MKKKTSPTQFTYSDSVSLYRDDLNDILDILNKVCDRVIIEDNQYLYESLDEVADKRGQNPERLSITGWEPYISLQIKIKRNQTVLETSGDGSNLGPYFTIHSLFRKRRRVGNLLLVASPFFFLMFCGLFASFRYEQGLQQMSGWAKFGIFMFPILGLGIVTITHGLGAFSKISLVKKHEESSFWLRNKDTIIVSIIIAIITAVVSSLITYISTKP